MAYQKIEFGPGFARRDGKRLVLVHEVGSGAFPSWGYTIWLDGRCLAGACNWNWDLSRAKEEAGKALAAQVEVDRTPGEIVEAFTLPETE